MVDPLSTLHGGTAAPSTIRAEAHAHWSDSYRHGILQEDVTLVDRRRPPTITGVVDDSGQPLSYERRQQLAAAGRVERMENAFGEETEVRYVDAPELVVDGQVLIGPPEKLGHSAVELRRRPPMFVPARKDVDDAVESAAKDMSERSRLLELESRINNRKE